MSEKPWAIPTELDIVLSVGENGGEVTFLNAIGGCQLVGDNL